MCVTYTLRDGENEVVVTLLRPRPPSVEVVSVLIIAGQSLVLEAQGPERLQSATRLRMRPPTCVAYTRIVRGRTGERGGELVSEEIRLGIG